MLRYHSLLWPLPRYVKRLRRDVEREAEKNCSQLSEWDIFHTNYYTKTLSAVCQYLSVNKEEKLFSLFFFKYILI